MRWNLRLYNFLTRSVEEFKPVTEGEVGMYVCGPTVYGSPHMGHARSIVTFDLLYRILNFCGYRVKYVRNVTDVGHMESDADEGEDKIVKKAIKMNLRPEVVAHKYFLEYLELCNLLNAFPPSVQPFATAHIQEQIEMVKLIMKNGFAYRSAGSVYFDVALFNKKYGYGKLSGRDINELQPFTRELRGTSQKRNPYDFALWKEASPSRLMKWDSPWGQGFPGWHLECSAMSIKYLGSTFDIHGGGIDLIFPHHECEIAQNMAAYGQTGARFWIYNNLVTIDGQKMSKQLGNYIEPLPLIKNGEITGNVLRFYFLTAKYRSPLNFTNKGLQDARSSLYSLFDVWQKLMRTSPSTTSTLPSSLKDFFNNAVMIILDDMDTPRLFAFLFSNLEELRKLAEGTYTATDEELSQIQKNCNTLMTDILGFLPEKTEMPEITENLINLIVQIRHQLRQKKEYQLSDYIRNEMIRLNISLMDTPEGTKWQFSY